MLTPSDRGRPATASYRYRTPFHSSAPSGTSPAPPPRPPPARPSTGRSSSPRDWTATLCVSPLARNRYHQGSFRPAQRADLKHTARGRPIELMWGRGPARPAAIPPKRGRWDNEDYVFTNTQYVLRTMVDKALAHNSTLKTVQLYCDADKSRGHKHDLVNGSVVTKSSMGKALEKLGFTLKQGQVDSIFETLSERNVSKHAKKDKQLGQMNAGTFLENLRDCHELDADKTHWTRFGSSMFAFTSRHENKGIDKYHRFPPKILSKGEVCQIAEAKRFREEKEQHRHPHLRTHFDPFHHNEPTEEHDYQLERAQAREAYRRKQKATKEHRQLHTHRRKRRTARSNEFVTTTKRPIWGKYSNRGGTRPIFEDTQQVSSWQLPAPPTNKAATDVRSTPPRHTRGEDGR